MPPTAPPRTRSATGRRRSLLTGTGLQLRQWQSRSRTRRAQSMRRSAPTRPSGRQVDRERVARLVHIHRDAARQRRGDDDAVPMILGVAADDDAVRAQLANGGVDVVADERQLVLRRLAAGAFSGMDAELRRWERENQPAVPGIDRP